MEKPVPQTTSDKASGHKQAPSGERPADRKSGEYQPHNAKKEALGPNTKR